jgi:hypothetical protein
MDFAIIPDDEALARCGWCDRRISEEAEVFAFGARLRPGIDLARYQSHCIEIGLESEEKPVYALVTVDGSDAKQGGKDLMFLTCSESCGLKLKAALEKEVSIGELLGHILP